MRKTNLTMANKNCTKKAALAFAAALSLASLTGCAGSEKPAETTVTETTAAETTAMETTAAETTADETTAAETTATETTADEATTDATLEDILNDIKEAYGEAYVANSPMNDEMLEAVVGLSPDLCEAYVAETPMISAHVETFIGVKAAEGKGDDVEAALTAYRERLVNDTMQYPMNISKIQASQVVRHDDYVFFVMLGSASDEALEKGDEAALASAKESNQIAIDIIDGYFQ